jgi:hypothetical protein
MFEGLFSFVTDPIEKLHAFVLTNECLGVPSESLQKVLDTNLVKTTVGKITILSMTGKKEGVTL